MKRIDIERKAISIINDIDEKHSLLCNYSLGELSIIFHTRSRKMPEVCVATEYYIDDFQITQKDAIIWDINKNHRNSLLNYLNLI